MPEARGIQRMVVIQLSGVVREYSPGHGVRGITLSVAAGECFAAVGRNGSGKSTLARLLTGLDRPAAGTVAVFGHRVDRGVRAHLPRTGYLAETSRHWDALTGRANAWFTARSYGLSRLAVEARLKALLDATELSAQADHAVAAYSFGMRRKLGIVQAVCHDPDLLILDEPTAGLDTPCRTWLAQHVRERCASGKTTWISSADPEWVSAIATRAAFLVSGRITAEGPVSEFLAEAPHPTLRDAFLLKTGGALEP